MMQRSEDDSAHASDRVNQRHEPVAIAHHGKKTQPAGVPNPVSYKAVVILTILASLYTGFGVVITIVKHRATFGLSSWVAEAIVAILTVTCIYIVAVDGRKQRVSDTLRVVLTAFLICWAILNMIVGNGLNAGIHLLVAIVFVVILPFIRHWIDR